MADTTGDTHKQYVNQHLAKKTHQKNFSESVFLHKVKKKNTFNDPNLFMTFFQNFQGLDIRPHFSRMLKKKNSWELFFE